MNELHNLKPNSSISLSLSLCLTLVFSHHSFKIGGSLSQNKILPVKLQRPSHKFQSTLAYLLEDKIGANMKSLVCLKVFLQLYHKRRYRTN